MVIFTNAECRLGDGRCAVLGKLRLLFASESRVEDADRLGATNLDNTVLHIEIVNFGPLGGIRFALLERRQEVFIRQALCLDHRPCETEGVLVVVVVARYAHRKTLARPHHLVVHVRRIVEVGGALRCTVDDFKTVIDKKCDEWIGTEWEKYLRPETLFGTKFEGYLNAKTTKKNHAAMNKGIPEGVPDPLDALDF